MQILLCCGKHKLDPVQLIYFAGTWIVVDGNNVGFRMLTANFLDDTFSYDVVRQASKRLDADDVRDTAVDEFHHLSGQEPSFTGLISGRNDGAAIFARSRISAAGVKWRLCSRASFAVFLSQSMALRPRFAMVALDFLNPSFSTLNSGVEAVADKVDKIRNNRFSPSASRRSARWFVGSRQELDKDLTYDTNARLFLIGDRDRIKIMDHLTAHFF